MATRTNDALTTGQSPYYIKRTDIPHHSALLNSLLLNMLHSRAVYNMSSVDNIGDVYDMSGQGRKLTNTNFTFSIDLVTPYGSISAGRLLRGDEVGLQITADLTLLALCRFSESTGGTECIEAKWGAVGNKSYQLVRNSSGYGVFSISSNGTAVTSVTGTYAIPNNQWVLMVGIYTPSTSMDLFTIPFIPNGVNIDTYKYTNTTSIPAAIFNSTAPFTIGSNGIGGEQFKGDVMHCGLYATAQLDRVVFSVYELAKPVTGA